MDAHKPIPYEVKIIAYYNLMLAIGGMISFIIISRFLSANNDHGISANAAINLCIGLLFTYIHFKIFINLRVLNIHWRNVAILLMCFYIFISFFGLLRLMFTLTNIPFQIVSPIPDIIPPVYFGGFFFLCNIWVIWTLTRKDIRELFITEDQHEELVQANGTQQGKPA